MVQSLLVRSLVAWLWDEPVRAPLIRHGANLHGRYLLPHFLIHDIADVAADLRAHDINFDTSWLDPFTEFRFPRIGTAVFDGVEIELRGAIEPWNTLGEEVHRRRHRPLRRLVGGTHPGAAHRRRPAPVRRHGQRISGAAAGHRHPRRAGRRRAVPGLATAQRAAPHHHGRRAAALRTRRHRDGDVARRLHLPRVTSGRSFLRDAARQRRGGGIAPGPPLRGDRLHTGPGRHVRHPREAGAPVNRRRRAWHSRFCVECVPSCA